jgi:putative RNA 2'-phosphotransferase
MQYKLCKIFLMNRLIKISKFLSYYLRHRPDLLDLELASGGWVAVDLLLKAANKLNFPISYLELQQAVAHNDKQRFSFDETGDLIRANQGHSIEIDLQLKPVIPPAILYHGTYSQVVSLIEKQGLKKMSRHHVHLSPDLDTAKKVGARRGYPAIFQVNASAMSQAGYTFYCSNNGVWLTEFVPVEYLTLKK